MSKKLCLQWNDFKENVNSAFGRLREDKEFIDVSLVCEDDQVIYAHKVILTSSSPFFEKYSRKSNNLSGRRKRLQNISRTGNMDVTILEMILRVSRLDNDFILSISVKGNMTSFNWP